MLYALLLQAAAPACTAPAPVPPELAGWAPMTSVKAAATPVAIAIGYGARASLRPATGFRPVVPTDRATPGTSAGVFAFTVMQPGRYRVALGAGAWIDVVAGGKALESVAHGHGPACSPVRKMVDFDLRPGRYLLQLVGSPTPELPLIIARLP